MVDLEAVFAKWLEDQQSSLVHVFLYQTSNRLSADFEARIEDCTDKLAALRFDCLDCIAQASRLY